MISIIWGAATAVLLFFALRRDSNGRAFVPWSFPLASAVIFVSTLMENPLWLPYALAIIVAIVVFARFQLAMVAVMAMAALVFGPAVANATTDNDSASSAADTPADNPSPAPSASASAESTDACPTWATKSADYGKLRWFANGVAEIKQAETDAEARAAADVWLGKVKTDPLLLASAAKSITGDKVDKTDLTSDGCATDKAVELVTEMQADLGQADISVVDKAPSGTTTSGVTGNSMVSFPVTGNDPALQMDLPSGKTIYVESGCGNIAEQTPVFPAKPPKSTTPRETPPPTTPPTTPPPTEKLVQRCDVTTKKIVTITKEQAKNNNRYKPVGSKACKAKPPKEECPPGQVGTPPDCLESKPHENDPDPVEGTTPLDQPDPVEVTPRVEPDPIDTDEKPGDSAPDVPAPDSDPVPTDDGPPPVTDEDNTPSQDDPGTEIEDPDAGLLIPLLPLLAGVARLRRKE